MFYEEIFDSFQKDEIQYLVVGGVAVNLHGVPRMTCDLDLLVQMNESNLRKVLDRLATLGYKPRLPVDLQDLIDPIKRKKWIQEKNLKAFTFYKEGEEAQEIDLLVDTPIDYEEASKRVVIKMAGDLKIPLVSIKDLIRLKEVVLRKQDESDIRLLLRVLDLEGEQG